MSLPLRPCFRVHFSATRKLLKSRRLWQRFMAASDGVDISVGQRYKVSLSKPLGLVLGQDFGSKVVFVDSVVEGGNAENTGRIQEGDLLIATSGVIYTNEKNYGNAKVKGGEQIVEMNVTNESFDAVLAAIGSHPGHIPVELEFERTDGDNESNSDE